MRPRSQHDEQAIVQEYHYENMESGTDSSSARGGQRKVTTYGKFAKRRPTTTTDVSSSAYDFPADDDEFTAPPRKPNTSSSEPSRRASPALLEPIALAKGRVRPPSKALGTSLTRKRKIQQVSPEKPATPDPLPAAAQRPALSTYGSSFRNRRVQSNQSSDSSSSEPPPKKLSSSPRTPTPPPTTQPNKRRSITQETLFSPSTMQSWEKLGRDPSPDQDTNSSQHHIPVRLASKSSLTEVSMPSQKRPTSTLTTNHAISKSTGAIPRQRKRLIDTLAEQTTPSQDESDSEASDDADKMDTTGSSQSQQGSQQTIESNSQGSNAIPSTPAPKVRPGPATQVRTFARSSSALKFQYGQQNKILEEEVDIMDSLSIPEPSTSLKGRRLELGGPKKKPGAGHGLDDDDLDVDSPKRMIRNIHELRQAGATSRDADEMADLSYQVGSAGGSPSSSRRTALIQIAEKLHDKAFVRKYRAHNLETTIFQDIGREVDPVTSCLIASILIIVLAKERSAHTMQILHGEDPSSMLLRLMSSTQSLKELVRDRKSNLSKRNQTAILDIQKAVSEPAIWKGPAPAVVSPRTLALKALRYLVVPEEMSTHVAVLTPAVTEALFSISAEITRELQESDDPEDIVTIDLEIAVSILHDYAAYLSTLANHDNNEWATAHLPVVADLFGVTLGKQDKALEKSVLKLTINMVNHNLAAPDIFVSKGLVQPLAASLCDDFGRALNLVITDQKPTEGLLDGLVLELGILINFCEHSALARKTVFECGSGDNVPIDQIIRLFLDNRRKTSEADSVEKSHLNVVFGYLTILLGYLALYPPVRQKFRASHAGKNMTPLLESIREFMSYHRKMESLAGEDEEENKDTESHSLQALAYKIEDEAAYD